MSPAYFSTKDRADMAWKIAVAIAPHLDGFHARREQDVEWAAAYLDGPDGQVIYVSVDWSEGKRVTFMGKLPGERDDSYDVKTPTISCATTRGGKVHAAEITRRLLPDYIEALTKVQGRVTRRLDNERTKHGTVRELLAAFPKLYHHTGSDRIHGGSTDIRVSHTGDSAEITFRSVDVPTLHKLLADYFEYFEGSK